MVKKKKIKKILNVPNKIVNRAVTVAVYPAVMTLGVKILKKKVPGLSTKVARREMKDALKRRLKW